jgi:hypothetical protein
MLPLTCLVALLAMGVPAEAETTPIAQPAPSSTSAFQQYSGWIGTEVGMRFGGPSNGGLFIGWEGGLLDEYQTIKYGVGLGMGARFTYVGSWLMALPVRLEINRGVLAQTPHAYAQAGPARIGGRWGVDGEMGVDWLLAAFFVSAHHSAEHTAILIGGRFSPIALLTAYALAGVAR